MVQDNDEVLSLMQALEKRNVLYLIVGGFAVNRYGYSRATGDLDILLKDTQENRINLIDALADMGYGRFDALLRTPILAGYCEIMMDNGMYADLMTDIPGINKNKFDDYYAKATVDEVDGVTIRFISYQDLIINKTATGRAKDSLDTAELKKINGL